MVLLGYFAGLWRACGARIRLVEGATAPTRSFFYGVLEGDKLNLFFNETWYKVPHKACIRPRKSLRPGETRL